MSELASTETETPSFKNISAADDTKRMIFYLNQIKSCSRQNLSLVINAENAGTVMRFLASLLSVTKGKWLLTGSKRMKQRPIGTLVSALQVLGAEISYTDKKGYPPLKIIGNDLKGGFVHMDADISSQFISSLMMIAPSTLKGITIDFNQKPVSFPYIRMTQKLMKLFGVEAELTETSVNIKPSEYQVKDLYIEPDWSSASYWYEIAALADQAEIFLKGFTKNSVQGDSCVWQIFDELGVYTEFKNNGIQLISTKTHTTHFQYDFTDAPDLVPAVLTTCAAKRIKATITGVDHLKHKESDRMQALGIELTKIGAVLKSINGVYTLTFTKSKATEKTWVFETYKDHRMAMCFAPLVFIFNDIVIKDKNVVDKSYPAFWNDLKKLKIVDLNL